MGVAGLIAAGCGSSASPSSAPATTLTTTAAAPATAPVATAAATKITATLTEFHIALSRTDLTAGRYTFVSVNAGHTVHSLSIVGPGVDRSLGGALQPGRTASLTVDLAAGKYDVFCPVGDHKALGMNLELTVGA